MNGKGDVFTSLFLYSPSGFPAIRFKKYKENTQSSRPGVHCGSYCIADGC